MAHVFVPARGFWLRVLDLFGCDGLAMPWRRVYMRPSCLHNDGLRAHEWVHIQQIDRMGPVWFSLRYLYELIRYGYREMPMEREANEVQAHAERYRAEFLAAYEHKRTILRL